MPTDMEHPAEKEKKGVLTLAESWQLRGVAMLMILFAHSINEYPTAMTSEVARLLLVPHWGIVGSGIFLLLSGYGMLCSLQGRGGAFAWSYWRRKAKQLLLPYAVAFVVTALALDIYDAKYGSPYTIDLSNLLTLSLSDGNELWFFKTIAVEYALLLVLNRLRMRAMWQVGTMALVHFAAIGAMVSAGLPRYWWASDIGFVVGMALAMWQTRRRRGQPWVPTSRVLTYIGKNSLCFYLLEIPVMWMLPSDRINLPMFFGLTVVLTALLTELYRRSFGKI